MRIGVIHDSLNFAGGAERVCLKTIEAFRNAGHTVVLGTIEATDWSRLARIMGPVARPDEEEHLLSFGKGVLRLYMSLASPIILKKVRRICDKTICTNGDLMLLDTDYSYMHYVPVCLAPGRPQAFDGLLRPYVYPYKLAQYSKLKALRRTRLLMNSSFTREMLREWMDVDSRVVYPPVDVERFAVPDGPPRRKRVVACGRFSPEKNFEQVLEIASRVEDAEFVILGSFSGALSRAYYRSLLSAKRSRGLSNVVIAQSSFKRMLSLFGSSTLFINSTVNESFGLSIVEAMASGLVPLVHRSGGPWEDILERKDGVFGYAFKDSDEAASIVKDLLSHDRNLAPLVDACRARSSHFSDSVFKSKMLAETVNS